MVEVRVFGALWEHLEPRLQLDLEGCDISVADLLARLDIDAREVGIVTVDRRQSNFDKLVPASCRVCIFPPISGG
jgi:molybdopterin converting factor small subunit